MSRYVLHPGYVISKTDADRHYIDRPTLAALYGLTVRDCVHADSIGYRERVGDIHLSPRNDGDYDLNKCRITQEKANAQ